MGMNKYKHVLPWSLKFEGETFITLSDYEGYVNRNDTDLYRPGERDGLKNETPRADPLTLKVSNREAPVSRDIGTARAYEVILNTVTDIWFDETLAAKENRERLATALSCLHKSLPDGGRHFGGDKYGERAPYEIERLQPLVPWETFE